MKFENFKSMVSYKFETVQGDLFSRTVFDETFNGGERELSITQKLYQLMNMENINGVLGNEIAIWVLCENETIKELSTVFLETTNGDRLCDTKKRAYRFKV